MFLLSEIYNHSSFEGLRYEASRESVICVVIRIRRATRTKELVAIFNDDNLVDDGINELKSLINMEKDIYGDVKYLHLDSGRVYTFRDSTQDYLLIYTDASSINRYLDSGSWGSLK